MKNHQPGFKSLFIAVSFAAVVLALPFAFQACGEQVDFKQGTTPMQSTTGNGDSYTGKIGYYVNFDAQSPCARTGVAGTPLPNKEIFVLGRTASLVRERCENMEPIQLNESDLVYATDVRTGNSTLTFNGDLYQSRDDLQEFDSLPKICPVGRNVIAGAQPTNLFNSPLNWLTNDWFVHSGISVDLSGAIEALPRFRLERKNAASLDYWQRAGQIHPLQPDVDYAYSVYLQPGNVSHASVVVYQTTTSNAGLVFNLQNGTFTIHHNVGLANLSARLEPVANGYLATVFFTAPQNSTNVDIGVATYSDTGNDMTNLGDFIYAAAASLREVGSYCSP